MESGGSGWACAIQAAKSPPPLGDALDGIQDQALEVLVVAQGRVAAELTSASGGVKMIVEAAAGAVLAVVEGKGGDAEEANEGKKLAHPVLERRSGEAPPLLSCQGKCRAGGSRRFVLDKVGLVQDNATPGGGGRGETGEPRVTCNAQLGSQHKLKPLGLRASAPHHFPWPRLCPLLDHSPSNAVEHGQRAKTVRLARRARG